MCGGNWTNGHRPKSVEHRIKGAERALKATQGISNKLVPIDLQDPCGASSGAFTGSETGGPSTSE